MDEPTTNLVVLEDRSVHDLDIVVEGCLVIVERREDDAHRCSEGLDLYHAPPMRHNHVVVDAHGGREIALLEEGGDAEENSPIADDMDCCDDCHG